MTFITNMPVALISKALAAITFVIYDTKDNPCHEPLG